jgi:hypothetical protein
MSMGGTHTDTPLIHTPGIPTRVLSAVFALGIISAPGREHHRREVRQTWAAPANVPHDVEIRFVMQRGNTTSVLQTEGYNDVVLSPYDDPRARSSWRKQWLWFEHALFAFPNARFIAKCEDDVYLHLHGIRRLLDVPAIERAGRERHAIIGNPQYFSWIPELNCPVGFDFSWTHARKKFQTVCGDKLSNRTGKALCYGPFPFMQASLTVLSRTLVDALVRSPATAEVHQENVLSCPALQARETLTKINSARTLNKFTDLLADDVWLGYALRRFAGHSNLSWFTLSNNLLFDDASNGGLIADVTLSAHDRRKSAVSSDLDHPAALGAPADDHWARIRRMHAFVHYFHCSPELAVSKSTVAVWPTSTSKGMQWPEGWEMLVVSPVLGKHGVALRVRDAGGPACTGKMHRTKLSVEQVLDANRTGWQLDFVRMR